MPRHTSPTRPTPAASPDHGKVARKPGTIAVVFAALFAALCAALPSPAQAALTDLSTSPLQTATPVAKPNLLFILDDSGSMSWDFMPDWADTSNDTLARNSAFNATYYNPAIHYEAPLRPDGSRYPTMNTGTTNGWRSVPFDGFGVQTPRGTGNVLFTRENDGATQDLRNRAYYYVFIPGEFCTDITLKTCRAATATSAAYPYPALVRWCSDAALTNCRATRIDTPPAGGLAYTRLRAAGVSGVPGRNMLVDVVATRNSYAYPGTDKKAPGRTDCAGDTCTHAEEMTNFANWWAYYRTRMQMAKSAASLAFADVNNKFRIGYMSINNNTGSDFLNVRDVDSDTNGQKFQWYTKLLAAEPGSSTPLRTALSTAGRYFARKLTTVNGVSASDPMQYACQRNYTMLSTDGYWNERNAPVGINGGVIGDTDGVAGVERPYFDGLRKASTLADVAQYFYTEDLRSEGYQNTQGALGGDVASNDVEDKQQRMFTSTIGLGASGYMQYRPDYDTVDMGDYATILKGSRPGNGVCGWQTSGSCNWPSVESNTQTTIDDLWHAAVNGRGHYYSAASPIELRDGLQAFIQEAGRGGMVRVTSPAVSSLNLTEEDNLAFGSGYVSGAWFGEVYAYKLNPLTAQAEDYYLWSTTEALPSGMSTRTSPRLALTTPAAIDARKIYTSEFVSTTGTTAPRRIDFKWPAMSAATRQYFRVAAVGTLSQFCPSGAGCVPTASRVDSDNAGLGTGFGGINLVNFLRGSQLNEGQSSASYYRDRQHILGDIIDAQPVYVKKPLFNYTDTGYQAYKDANATRDGMLYVGANDGMLHAFQTTDTPALNGAGISAAGTERWAYIPSMLLPSLYRLADKDYANRHVYYVNATPRVGDVYDKANQKWRTVLVGGLGRGGRGYYALDITDARAAPTVLWEFSSESRKGVGHISDQDLGYTFGTPIITKLSDGAWVVIVPSGHNNVSPGTGKGHVWVLDALTGKVISKIATTAGDTGTPSGLAHIKVFADNADRNNLGTRVYGGDMLGNVWRIDLTGLTSTGGAARVVKLATLTGPTGVRQPVTSAPELGKVAGSPVIYVGTGAYLGMSDLGTNTKQSLYAIKDPLTDAGTADSVHGVPRATTCGANKMDAPCFMRQEIYAEGEVRKARSTASYPMDFSTMKGWYIDLPDSGERMVYEAELQRGILAFMTTVPGSPVACRLPGKNYLNFLDYATGLAVKTEKEGITGYPVDAVAGGGVTAVGTANGKLAVMTGDNVPDDRLPGDNGDDEDEEDENKDPRTFDPPAGEGTRRISWRELITDK